MTEVLSAVGLPARLLGRLPLLVRYLFRPKLNLSQYGEERYHDSFSARPWLWFDALELELIEDVLHGTKEEVEAFRKPRLDTAGTTGAVGGLLASASSTILSFDSIAEIHYVCRGLFISSLLFAVLSVYFTLLQQRELLSMNTDTFRVWLWDGEDGEITEDETGREGPAVENNVTPGIAQPKAIDDDSPDNEDTIAIPFDGRSSLPANIVLQAPFELLGIAIALFLSALGVYLGLLYATKVTVSLGRGSNLAVMSAFVTTATFALIVFGQALGQKDCEMNKNGVKTRLRNARQQRQEKRKRSSKLQRTA